MSNNAQLINTYTIMKKNLTVVHVKELFVNDEGNAVFQIKLQSKKVVEDELGSSPMQETYYRKVINPKVAVGKEVTLELDNYDVVIEEFEPEGEDKVIKLKYLYNKR